MLNKLKFITLLSFALLIAGIFFYPNISWAEGNTCAGAVEQASQTIPATIQDPRIFSQDIIDGMYNMMLKIYETFGILFMMGHGLMCYASEALYTCAGLSFGNYGYCIFKIPHLSFYITGIFIYITAFFMTMSIGMYFLDVSFKLGFAVLLLPVSLALWPFPPTQNKLMDNLSIIIRNSMLFAFVSVGVSYAVILIKTAVFGDPEGWLKFWLAIDQSMDINAGRNDITGFSDLLSTTFYKNLFSNLLRSNESKEVVKDSIEYMTSTFSLDSIKILIIAFCMIFAFKILSASINQYLDTFFGDNVFGNSSPMHHMGTQALGTAVNNTVKPAAKLATDIAVTQTGRLIEGTGQSLQNLAQGNYSQAFTHIQRGFHAVTNPKETYNKGIAQIGNIADRSVRAAGNIATEIYDTAQILKPGEYNEEARLQNTKKFRNKINSKTQAIGEKLNNTIVSKGSIKTKSNQNNPEITTPDNSANSTEPDNNSGNNGGNGNSGNNGGNSNSGNNGGNGNSGNNSGNGNSGNNSGNGNSSSDSTQLNNNPHNAANPTSVRSNSNNSGVVNTQQSADNKKSSVKQAIAEKLTDLNNFTRPTATSLTPGNIVKGGKKLVKDPKQTFNTIKKMAQQGVQDWQNYPGSKGKLILKEGGQVVLRSVRGTTEETGKTALNLTGGFLKELGKSMQNNKRGNSESSNNDVAQRKQQMEEAQEDEELYNKTLVD